MYLPAIQPAATDCLCQDSGQVIRNVDRELRICLKPVADSGGLGVLGIQFQQAQVMLARPGRIAQPLRVEVRQREVGAGFGSMVSEQFFQFASSIARITALLQGNREIESCLEGQRIDGERVFIGEQALRQIASFIRRHTKIVLRIEERRIGRRRLAIFLDGFGQPVPSLRLNSWASSLSASPRLPGCGAGGDR